MLWRFAEVENGPGVRVLNLAGIGNSGWDIIDDSIDEDNQSMVWTCDTTEGKVYSHPLPVSSYSHPLCASPSVGAHRYYTPCMYCIVIARRP